MRYSISLDLMARTVIITRYRSDRIGPVRRETYYALTRRNEQRLLQLCRCLTPLKIHQQRGFYLFADLGQAERLA